VHQFDKHIKEAPFDLQVKHGWFSIMEIKKETGNRTVKYAAVLLQQQHQLRC